MAQLRVQDMLHWLIWNVARQNHQNDLCAQWRSVWASMQSDKESSLGSLLIARYKPYLCGQWRLIRLRRYAGWSESSMDTQVILLSSHSSFFLVPILSKGVLSWCGSVNLMLNISENKAQFEWFSNEAVHFPHTIISQDQLILTYLNHRMVSYIFSSFKLPLRHIRKTSPCKNDLIFPVLI